VKWNSETVSVAKEVAICYLKLGVKRKSPMRDSGKIMVVTLCVYWGKLP